MDSALAEDSQVFPMELVEVVVDMEEATEEEDMEAVVM